VTRFYLDASAAAKLLLDEEESPAMDRWMRAQRQRATSSDLLRTELHRAVRRVVPEMAPRVVEILATITLTSLSTSTYTRAAHLDPPRLGSLDALHLAAALELGDELEGIVTYDERMAEAAGLLGIAVVTPA